MFGITSANFELNMLQVEQSIQIVYVIYCTSRKIVAGLPTGTGSLWNSSDNYMGTKINIFIIWFCLHQCKSINESEKLRKINISIAKLKFILLSLKTGKATKPD